MMLANMGPREDPIETPSVCSYNSLLKEKMVLLQQSRISFFKEHLVNVVLICFSLKIRSKIILTVRDKGTLVNKETISNETYW